MVTAILAGELDGVETTTDPFFGLAVPKHVPDVPDAVLDPRASWKSAAEYDAKAAQLADMFAENFEKYESGVNEAVKAAGPRKVHSA
jgi:phosphoenolpyruvate carboxykinase (ATP)